MAAPASAEIRARAVPVFGLSSLFDQRPHESAAATQRQQLAARYLIGDLQAAASIDFEAARDLLAVRAYVIGLLISLARQGLRHHPREAMWWVLREVYHDTTILEAIRRWSKDRFLEDRGPPRVGATRFYEPLGQLVRTRCKLPPPTDAECLAVRDEQLCAQGLGALLRKQTPTIVYRDGDDTTTRRLSEVTLHSHWPWWSYWLINAPSFIYINAFCHLRQDYRTFAAFKIVTAN